MNPLRLGMIGLDTSHVPAFAQLLHREADPHHVPGARVVRAVAAGNPDLPVSGGRVAKFTAELRDFGVEIVPGIDELEGLDAYLLESVDGRQHLEQFESLARFGKPVFIDKPLACSLADARAIDRVARENNVPVMTASSLRYAGGIADLAAPGETVVAAQAFGPMAFAEGYRDYFWYGIHEVEMLYAILGRGCRTVRAFASEQCDVLVGTWASGALGTVTGSRGGGWEFGAAAMTDKAHRTTLAATVPPAYAFLLQKVVAFFRTGESPIDFAESLETIAFLEAASRSRADGGAPVELADL